MSGERRDGRIAHQKHVEVLPQVLVAARRRADAHVGVVTGQEHVADVVLD